MYKKSSYIKSILVFIFSVFSFIVSAQVEEEVTKKARPDSLYKKSMKDKMAFDFSVNNSSYSFNLNQDTNKQNLYPNLPGFLKLKLNYDFLSIGVQFKANPENSDEINRLKGKTKAFKIATSLIFKHWYSHLSYSQTTGYYLENTRDYIAGWNSQVPYIQYPNFKHNRFYISGGYILNSRFSLKNIISQTERQLKSAGSFIPVINVDYFILDVDNHDPTSNRLNNIEVTTGAGYTHTFVLLKSLYLSLGLSSSFGFLSSKTVKGEDASSSKREQAFSYRVDSRLGLGYNGKRVYTGAFFRNADSSYGNRGDDVKNSVSSFFYHFVVGYRFNPPKPVSKFINSIKSIL